MTLPANRSLVAAAIVIAMVALISGGCSFTRPAPLKATFLLEPAAPAVAAKPRDASLRIGIVNVAGPFRDRSFVMRVDDLLFETDYYHEFVTPPASMIGELTSRALAHARVFAHVAAPGSPMQAQYVLDGFVSDLYADHRVRGRCTAVIAVTFYLSRADSGSGVPFWSKDYRRSNACSDDSTESYVKALNRGFSEILSDLVHDLASVELPAEH